MKNKETTKSEYQTISYRLGKALIDAKTVKGALTLPWKLYLLREDAKSRRSHKKPKINYEQLLRSSSLDKLLIKIHKKHGLLGVTEFLEWYDISAQEKSNIVYDNALTVKDQNPKLYKTLMGLSIELNSNKKNLKAYAWTNYYLRDLNQLEMVINKLFQEGEKTNDQEYFALVDLFSHKLTSLLSDKSMNTLEEYDVVYENNLLNYKSSKFPDLVLEFYFKYGKEKLLYFVEEKSYHMGTADKAFLLLKVSKALSAHDKKLEIYFCEEALKIDQSEKILRASLWVYQRNQDFANTSVVLRKLVPILEKSSDSKQKLLLEKIYKSPAYSLLVENHIPSEPRDMIDSIPNRIAYVLHNSFPYSSGGYATRAFGVCEGLKSHGFEVVIINRPGFPIDIKDDLDAEDVPETEIIDGYRYVRSLSTSRRGMTPYDYMLEAANVIETRFREYRPQYVIAASNHITAIPSLIAAKRLGIPFYYEVRGLWEITRVSREPEFEKKPAYTVQVLLETLAAKHATHVFTLTNPMINELVRRGVEKEAISLVPNSCSPDNFIPKERDMELVKKLNIPDDVPVIGYIGTFVQYEGLDDLAEACAILKFKGVPFRLLLVGNENASGQDVGPITAKISEIATTYGFNDWLIMPGRIPFEEVESYYSLIDIAPFPRKSQPVCELVSPMKPLEALAMKKAVLVSSVQALKEMVIENKTGLVFEKGNVSDLADKLQLLMNDKSLRKTLGENGRAWVEVERNWVKTTTVIKNELYLQNNTY
ncbi:glycosyltransferase family 4 protein [Psychrobacter sp. NPDC078631]|uniref:glycosyltransferase family 4 protein n=1 Tax=Psychrobacter sp. NPDC078631 TaxID=3390666 RepID=UPI003CFC1966